MKVLVKMVGEKAKVMDIENTCGKRKEVLGASVSEISYIRVGAHNVVAVMCDAVRDENSEYNVSWGNNYWMGNIMFLGFDGYDLKDLKDEEIRVILKNLHENESHKLNSDLLEKFNTKKYRLMKLVDSGEWCTEGVYESVEGLTRAAFYLGRHASIVDNIKVEVL